MITRPVKMRDGRVVYPSADVRFDAWMLPVTSSFVSAGPLSPVKLLQGMTIHPSISPDGNVLLWSHWGAENSSVMRKDLTSESEPAVVARLPGRSWTKFLADGRVAYLTDTDSDRSAAVALGSPDSGPGERMASVRAYPWDVSADGRWILERSETDPERVLVTGQGETRVLLEDPSRDVTLAHFSPDSAWVAFIAGDRIHIAPFPAGKPWIEASATPASVAEWAPDGSALYFVSEADGFACLWVQRLDPVRKHPVGAAVPVRHFHRYTLSPRDLPRRHQRFAAGEDKVVLILRRLGGNLFVAR